MFSSCSSLTSVSLASSVTSIGSNAFNSCTGLASLDFLSNVTTIGSYAFYNCTGLTAVEFPSNMDTVEYSAFNGCNSIQLVTSNSIQPFSLGSGAFDYDVYSNATLRVPTGTKSVYQYTDGWNQFSKIAEFGESVVTESVAKPTFSVNGSALTIDCSTSGANIYYLIEDLSTANSSTMESSLRSGSGILYNGYLYLYSSVLIKAFAQKAGMLDSPIATFQYDAEAWQNLENALYFANSTLYNAQGDARVSQQKLSEFTNLISEAQAMFDQRTASTTEVNQMTANLNSLRLEIETLLNTEIVETVATPAFSFNGDMLTISTSTVGASIYYLMDDLSSANSSLLETNLLSGSGNLYQGSISVTRSVMIKAFANMTGMSDSSIATLEYDYSAWQSLLEAIAYANDIIAQADGNTSVSQEQLADLQALVEAAEQMYESRLSSPYEVSEFTSSLRSSADGVSESIQGTPIASFDGLTARVSGGASLVEAFAGVGGVSQAAGSIAAIIWDNNYALTADMLSGISNPNLLIYVKDFSFAPSGFNNVIVNDYAASIVLSDTGSGNNNFYCPRAFTAGYISYTRNFTQQTEIGVSRGWETIALPFTVQSVSHEEHGAIYSFGNSSGDYKFWLREIYGGSLSDATVIEANKAYMICMPNSDAYLPEFNLSGRVTFASWNVTVPVTYPQSMSFTDGSITFIPTFQRVGQSSRVYALNVGRSSEGYPEGSAFVSNLRDVRPFEAYTSHAASSTRFITMKHLGDGLWTGIERSPEYDKKLNETVKVYNISGNLVMVGRYGDVMQRLNTGVYIINGRREIVRKD